MHHSGPAADALPRLAPVHRFMAAAMLAILLGSSLAHPSATRMHTWPWSAVTAGFWLVLVLLAVATSVNGNQPRWPNRLVPAGLLLLAAGTLVSALASPVSALALVRVWPVLGGVAACFLLQRWVSGAGENNSRAIALARCISAIGALVLIVSLTGWLRAHWPVPWVDRNAIPFGHSNYTAGFAVLVVPWCVWSAWRTRGVVRALWILCFGAGAVVVASTSSRGGALAFGASAAMATAIFLVRSGWSRRRKLMVAGGLSLLAVGTLLSNERLRTLVFERSWSDAASESNRQRQAMLQAGYELGRLRPWLGWGPGAVPLVYPRVRARLDGGVDNVLQLHNTPLQVWATGGIVGVTALLLLVTGSTQMVIARLRARPVAAEGLAAASSLSGYAIFALTDHQFDLPIIAALAGAGLALLCRYESGSEATASVADPGAPARTTRRLARRLGVSIALVAVAMLAVPLARDLRARQEFESALRAWETSDTPGWLAGLDRAAALAPADPFYQHQAAGARLQLRQREPDAGRRDELTRAAMERLTTSLGAGVHLEFAHFNLGWLELERDHPAEAARHFAAAARLVPDKGGVYFGLGLALDAAGERTGAVRAFALEWINSPAAMNSPAWELPRLAGMQPAVKNEMLRLYAELRDREPRAAAAEAWARWWLGEAYDSAALARGFSATARSFAQSVAALNDGAPVAGSAPWAQLYNAWRQAEESLFLPLAPRDPAFAAALHRRARTHRGSFRAFVTEPVGDEPALLRTFRRQRTGYGVLALHPDGPLLTDLYIVQENRISELLPDLLPPKGWLPGRLLLERLPPLPRQSAASKAPAPTPTNSGPAPASPRTPSS